MKYWLYMNNVVCGPYEKEKLADFPNFSLTSLLCPDTPGGGQAAGWKAASTFPEVVALFGAAPAPERPGGPAADKARIMMTMRGTLIDEPVIDEPPAAPPPAAAPVPAKAAEQVVRRPPEEKPAAGIPENARPVPGQAAGPQPDPLRERLEQMSAMLVSIGNAQTQLLERLIRVESAVADMKSLLFPAPPEK
ncbi:MAG: hypothetical protein HY550_02895 [Elusimicrobia bacterium]|nr:hypothetical protein [Elusimicrobiota bacterium]